MLFTVHFHNQQKCVAFMSHDGKVVVIYHHYINLEKENQHYLLAFLLQYSLEFPRTLHSGTSSCEGLYLAVYPSSHHNDTAPTGGECFRLLHTGPGWPPKDEKGQFKTGAETAPSKIS